jgi:CheY-like chemotaxis protein
MQLSRPSRGPLERPHAARTAPLPPGAWRLAAPRSADAPAAQRRYGPRSRPGRSLGRVLIVEDEALLVLDLCDLLTVWGYEVCGVAARAPDAIRQAAESLPDLAILDVKLEGAEDGIDVAKAIGSSGIPVIFITAHSDPVTTARMATAGPAATLVKPFTNDELREAIARGVAPRGRN